MMLPVADMDTVVLKVLRRFEAVDASQTTTITLGWDGARIAANLGDYNKLTKSMPTERVVARRGQCKAEMTASISIAVARLQMALKGKTTGGNGGRPRRTHIWRAHGRRDGIARGGNGE